MNHAESVKSVFKYPGKRVLRRASALIVLSSRRQTGSAPHMYVQNFISGLILGLLLGVLFCYVALRFLSRQRIQGRQQEIDRLTDDFQELFRQIDSDKNQN